MQITRSHMQKFLVLGLAGAVAACAAGSKSLPYLPAPESSAYVLGAGDELQIIIHGLEPYADATFTIDEQGMLSLPLLANLSAAGKSPSQIEADIKQVLLEREILVDPFVNVELAQLRPFYILGEVNQPGEYEYRPDLSAIAAVSIAGGFTYRADQETLVVSRLVDGRRIEGRVAPTDPIRPGDQIIVQERWF